MTLDYVALQARIKNLLLDAQGHYDLGNPKGGELVLVSEEQATELRSWWVNQVNSAWDHFNREKGILPEAQQRSLSRLIDDLSAIEVHETEGGRWLAYEHAIRFWDVTGKTAIQLNALGVVSSIDQLAWEAISEAVNEAPERIGEALGASVVAIGKTAGEALVGLVKGIGLTALIIAGVTVAAVIVLRRMS